MPRECIDALAGLLGPRARFAKAANTHTDDWIVAAGVGLPFAFALPSGSRP